MERIRHTSQHSDGRQRHALVLRSHSARLLDDGFAFDWHVM